MKLLKCKKLYVLTALALLGLCLFLVGFKELDNPGDIRILFTHDVHSALDTNEGIVNGEKQRYGGVAKLSTLLSQEKNDHSVYVDAGDFSMGTLYQAAFSTDAYELRMLGKLGCDVITFGNHEFDYGCNGVASALRAALASGDPLPTLVESSFNFDGELTEEQQNLKAALTEYGMQEYYIKEVNGLNLGFFGLEGNDSIECIQSNVEFNNYIEVAKKIVEELKDKCDIIICLSHSGTSGDGETGEDFDLLKEVPDIDIVISGHSHTSYSSVVSVNDGKSFLVSAGSNLENLGELDINMNTSGEITVTGYKLIPIDDSVEDDTDILATLAEYKQHIKDTYLKEYANGGDYDDVLCTSDFDFISLSDMYGSHQEYNTGDLIADSYKYMAEKNGINDIDVYLVGLGTIRGSITTGPVTLADAFEICSLGVGSDGSAGHPLLTAYITGEELDLLVELDASLGTLVSSIKMSYAGLNYTFNEARALLDRVTELYLVDDAGNKTELQKDKLYKVCCNMYAANMLGMLNGLTNGILKIVPKYADGTVIEDFYSTALLDTNGKEIKEWVAFKEYLSSFDDDKIPLRYEFGQDRKVKTSVYGLAVLLNAGPTTIVLLIVALVLFALVMLTGVKHVNKLVAKENGTYVPKKQLKAEKKAAKLAKKQANAKTDAKK